MVYSHGSSIFADALIKLLYYKAEKDKVRRQLIETNETDQWSGVGMKNLYHLKGITVNRK